MSTGASWAESEKGSEICTSINNSHLNKVGFEGIVTLPRDRGGRENQGVPSHAQQPHPLHLGRLLQLSLRMSWPPS
jgi:hypothetical protein